MSALKPLRLARLSGKDPFPLEITPTADGQRVATPRDGKRSSVVLPRPDDPPLGKPRRMPSFKFSNGPINGLEGTGPAFERRSREATSGAGAGRSIASIGEMDRPRRGNGALDVPELVGGKGRARSREPSPGLSGSGGGGGGDGDSPLVTLRELRLGGGGGSGGGGGRRIGGDNTLGGTGIGLGQVPTRLGKGSGTKQVDRKRNEPDRDHDTFSNGVSKSRPAKSGGSLLPSLAGPRGALPADVGGTPTDADGIEEIESAADAIFLSPISGPGARGVNKALNIHSKTGGRRSSTEVMASPEGKPLSLGFRADAHESVSGTGGEGNTLGVGAGAKATGGPMYDRRSKIVHAGHLMKLRPIDGVHDPSEMWLKRWVVLQDGYIMTFVKRSSDAPDGWALVDDIIAMRHATTQRPLPGTDDFTVRCCFTVKLDNGLRLSLRAKSTKEARHWMKAINAARGLLAEAEWAKEKEKHSKGKHGKGSKGKHGKRGKDKGSAPPSPSGGPPGGPRSPAGAGGGGGEDAVSVTGHQVGESRATPASALGTTPAPETDGVGNQPGSAGGGSADSASDGAGEWREQVNVFNQSKHFVNTVTSETARDADPTEETTGAAAAEAGSGSGSGSGGGGGGGDSGRGDSAAGKWVKAYDFDAKCEYFYHTVQAISTYERPVAYESDDDESRPEDLPPSGWGWGADTMSAGAGAASTSAATASASAIAGASASATATADGGSATTGDAAASPTPPGASGEQHWIECWDTTYNAPYYVNSYSDESTWVKPEGVNVIITPYAADADANDADEEEIEDLSDAGSEVLRADDDGAAAVESDDDYGSVDEDDGAS